MRRLCALMLVALLAASAMSAFAEAVEYGTMMVDNCEEWVSLRDRPATGGDRLAKVPLFAIVTDAAWSPEWGDFIRCEYDGQYGYILSKYLVPWADPEPGPNAHWESAMGFSFDYDAELTDVDEFGQRLTLSAADGDVPACLEIMSGERLGESPEAFLARNAPAGVEYETDTTLAGATLRWFRKRADNGGDVFRVFYTVTSGDDVAAAVGTCPVRGGEGWIAQFSAVMHSITFGDAAPVRVDWAEAARDQLVVDQDGAFVAIMADEPVADVALLALELADDGAFDATVLYAQDALEPGAPMVVKIAFPGDVPHCGLRFTDAGGEVRRYAIAVSGENGALRLEPF